MSAESAKPSSPLEEKRRANLYMKARSRDGDSFRQQGVGGLENLTAWTKKRRTALSQADFVKRTRGADSPKGILVCGIPGCGKSLAAKAVATTFNLPLLQMDMGSLMDKYQGESERNMRQALELAEAMSPCVLWIDELEKGFSGARSGQDGDNSFKRMFATLLNWMQENKKPCFIYATANDIGGLPKEFFRSGRFDALFAVYLPVCAECASIIVTSMEQAEANAVEEARLFEDACKDTRFLEALIDREMVRKGEPRILIGADISKLVNDALMFCHDADCVYPICRSDWENCLCRAMREGSVYGDGTENLDSIAVSYIRMLKKGFLTANGDALFYKEDYIGASQDGRHLRRMKDQELRAKWPHAYDQAVYHLLADRIDVLAEQVEAVERNRLIGS